MSIRSFPPAESDCALLLGQWALNLGATSVVGIHRSPVHAERLADCGITPVSQHDVQAIKRYATHASLVFDATGGTLADEILRSLPEEALFICYGLLSGKPAGYHGYTGFIHAMIWMRLHPANGSHALMRFGYC